MPKQRKRKAVSNDASGTAEAAMGQFAAENKWRAGSLIAVIALVMAVTVSVIHRNHIAGLFESDRHYSHLSDLEREMTLRTEMGFYFSFYKTLISAPTFLSGVDRILNDNVSEYGHTINTLKRFNLYPELVIAFGYRQFTAAALARGWKVQQCWRTERGDRLAAIVSCEGMGNSHYFYVNCAFAIAGTVAGSLFLLGFVLRWLRRRTAAAETDGGAFSDSLLGGALAVVFFFFNHGEATRVQWTPSLRETFGYPIFLALTLVVTYSLKYRLRSIGCVLPVAALTALFMLSWQFAQFALSSQVGSLVSAFLLDYVPARTLRVISFGHLLGFALGFVALFGNEMLLTSLFLASCVTIQILLSLWPFLLRISLRPMRVAIGALVFVGGTVGLKALGGFLIGVDDDSHIFAILASKFSNYSDFHTRMYTCAAEFDFLAFETVASLSTTFLLPAAIVACLFALLLIGKSEIRNLLWTTVEADVKEFGEIVFNLAQLVAVAAMALLLMRLKLFLVPQLCVVASLLLSFALFGGAVRPLWQWAVVAALVAAASVRGVSNLQQQWSIVGEYADVPQEQLLDWIAADTPADAVFAGAMPIMANVKLSTERPIINHPHYEDAGLRHGGDLARATERRCSERTVKVYTLFSNKPPAEVNAVLKSLRADYAIFEANWCHRAVKADGKKCGVGYSYDELDPANVDNAGLCKLLQSPDNPENIRPFVIAFQNDKYTVLRIS